MKLCLEHEMPYIPVPQTTFDIDILYTFPRHRLQHGYLMYNSPRFPLPHLVQIM